MPSLPRSPEAGDFSFSEDTLEKQSQKADRSHPMFAHTQGPRWLPAGRPEAFPAAAAPRLLQPLASPWSPRGAKFPRPPGCKPSLGSRAPWRRSRPRGVSLAPGRGPRPPAGARGSGRHASPPRPGTATSQSRADGPLGYEKARVASYHPPWNRGRTPSFRTGSDGYHRGGT